MRTNIDIDDTLMAEAMRAGGYSTKKETVEEALRLLARRAAYEGVRALRGTTMWSGNLQEMREDRLDYGALWDDTKPTTANDNGTDGRPKRDSAPKPNTKTKRTIKRTATRTTKHK
jgi:Arc/MetJ family transcription regulator